MKTTLTLEDVERLEILYISAPADVLYNAICPLLPLILPVIREHVKGNPEGLRPPQGACPPAGTDVVPVWKSIESAPKDGTKILVADIDDGVVFDVANGYFEVLEEDEEDGPWDIRDGEPWCSYHGREAGTYFCSWLPEKEMDTRTLFTPEFGYTHWMFLPPPGGTSAHPGSHPAGRESKAQASQKTSQEGSVCEVEPLGEVDKRDPVSWPKRVIFPDSFNSCCMVVENDENGKVWLNICEMGKPPVSLDKEKTQELVGYLTAWLHTGSFDLKGLPSSPPSSEDTELPSQPE